MLAKTLARVGATAFRVSDAALLGRSSRLCAVALNSTQAAAESSSAAEKFELKDSKGVRLSGVEFLESLRARVGAKESDADDWQVPPAAFESLLKEYDVLIDEGKEWKEKYYRSLAETENVRKRGAKQVEDAKQFAIQGFCKDLLEVADILDLAVDSVKPEDLKNANKQMKDLFDGISMTKQVLMKTFEKHGLRPNNPVGHPFDPNLHEAVFQVPGEQAKQDAGHIEHVMKIGYVLKERPIRPAQVGVVQG